MFIGLIKKCGHYFHFECIWEWLERKRDCPICRESCQLSETDLRGVSLSQALEISCVEVAIPGTSKAEFESQSNTSTLSSRGECVIVIRAPDANSESSQRLVIHDQGYGRDNGGFEGDKDTVEGSHFNNAVVTHQPRNVSTISVMFEQGNVSDSVEN